jgi:hypothetical protein
MKKTHKNFEIMIKTHKFVLLVNQKYKILMVSQALKPLKTWTTGIEISGIWLYVKHSAITAETSTEEIQVCSILGECPASWFATGEELMRRIKDTLHNEYKDEKKRLEIQKAISEIRGEVEEHAKTVSIFFDEVRD